MLELKRYVRDKKNEERASRTDRYIRINSKLLLRSYEIPPEEIRPFVKRLYNLLSPGLRLTSSAKGHKESDDFQHVADKADLAKLDDWITCSDFTVQIIPKAPTVLWLDLECMVCKIGGETRRKRKRHFDSKAVVRTVVLAVLEHTHHETPMSVDGGSTKKLYVSRGRTCGVHLFFPHVVVDTEEEVQRLWANVNMRLEETTGGTKILVDTGCSAMPLPLSRYHSGLSRINYSADGDIYTDHLTKPSFRDFIRFTNFYHMIGDHEKRRRSPTSSVSNISLTSSGTCRDRKEGDKCAPREPMPTIQTNGDCDRAAADDCSDKEMETAEETLPAQPSDIRNDEHTTYRAGPEEKQDVEHKGQHHHTVCPGSEERQDVQSDVVIVMDENEEKVSGASSSSSSTKHLVQADIRSLCSKVSSKQSRKRKNTSRPDEDLFAPDKKVKTDDVSTVDKQNDRRSEWSAREEDDSVSSFLGVGYRPAKLQEPYSRPDPPVDHYLHNRQQTHLDVTKVCDATAAAPSRPPNDSRTMPSEGSSTENLSVGQSIYHTLRRLYVPDESASHEPQLPAIKFSRRTGSSARHGSTPAPPQEHKVWKQKEEFKNSMKLRLESGQNQVHETDIQLVLSSFNAELDFYTSMVNKSIAVKVGDEQQRLRVKPGCSLNARRDQCPAALFPENVPHVLYTQDFVTETEWVGVLVRYFDEYLNNAPFLYVLRNVIQNDENVKNNLDPSSRTAILECVQDCLFRFKYDMIGFQKKLDKENNVRVSNVPKHPYKEKCTVVAGLMAVCSLAFKMVTPVFTDLAKVCRLMAGNNEQTLDSLNSSTMSTTGGDQVGRHPNNADVDEYSFFDESTTQVAYNERVTAAATTLEEGVDNEESTKTKAELGNDHAVIASILRWNYSTLSEDTLWCLFFYYYHVHADGLTRILNEVVHGGLMVTAVLQAYFEQCAENAPIDVPVVCNQIYKVEKALRCSGQGDSDDERGGEEDTGECDEDNTALMPPPKNRGLTAGSSRPGNKKKAATRRRKQVETRKGGDEKKRDQFQKRPEASKRAQRKVQEARDGRRDEDDSESGGEENGARKSASFVYKTSFDEVLALVVHRYLRPVAFDETTVYYTERGYEQYQNEFTSYFSHDKDRKRSVTDMFNRAVLKYSMPHGDLLLYNTDLTGTVHRRSSCANNLVLNIFENLYGGCMTYLTRRYDNFLKVVQRFNGDAYRLVVECRHAMNELVRSVELSYINLILRQPVVPPVLETDIAVRRMFMSREEILKGAFVCLNPMDYARCTNMFTKHSRFSQENCQVVESFLDKMITDRGLCCFDSDRDSATRFRTVYLFFLLYIFEVLYKIRHAYNRDRTYYVSVERLSWDVDVRLLLKLFFGQREFKTPRGLTPDILEKLDLANGGYEAGGQQLEEDFFFSDGTGGDYGNGGVGPARCINTCPLVRAALPDKMSRMMELFGKKGIVVMKSYAPLHCDDGSAGSTTGASQEERQQSGGEIRTKQDATTDPTNNSLTTSSCSGSDDAERERAFLNMAQTELEQELYSSTTWYENCSVRMKAVRARVSANVGTNTVKSDVEPKAPDTCMDSASMETFLRTQLRVIIDNARLNDIDRAVHTEKRDFSFCTLMPLRTKVIALVLATHATKRLTTDLAADFVRKEYSPARIGRNSGGPFTFRGRLAIVKKKKRNTDGLECDEQEQTLDHDDEEEDSNDSNQTAPDLEWNKMWNGLLEKRKRLMTYCRKLAEVHFPDNYFFGLHPDATYNALYDYMLSKPQYTTLRSLQKASWTRDVCAALNYLLVMNAYNPELVELCLRLFLGFEWPGQWAKRIFVWKSNSNAGKSFFFQHVINKAFHNSTSINDPKGGKENAPEKSEYYKNFVLMINEFSSASAAELKKLCSTSSYKFRMNFGNQMIQAFMLGKMVFNCNTLPPTTDHATIQRVALVPLPFWFQKRQSVVDSMLNWTRGQSTLTDYEKNFRRNVTLLLSDEERQFFVDNQHTRNEDELFNRPNELSLQLLSELNEQNARASMFLVQNKASQVYMLSQPDADSIVSGVVFITRYFCRFRFFNNIKEPVDYAVLPTACTAATQEWQRISQPYFDWKERYRVQKDYSVRTKTSEVHASLHHFAKNYAKNTSFFDLQQFFEWDFAEHKIPYYNAKEDEYHVRLDPIQE